MLVEFGALEAGKRSVTISYRNLNGTLKGTPMAVYLDRARVGALSFDGEPGKSLTISLQTGGKLRCICSVTATFGQAATEGEIIVRNEAGDTIAHETYRIDGTESHGGTFYDEWEV